MQKSSLCKIEKLLFAVIGVLIVFVLLIAVTAHNTVDRSRPYGDYRVLRNVSCEQVEKVDAPIGMANEYRFTLGKIGHADTLAFYINHHNIEVYVSDECVYSVTESSSYFRTTGGIWTMLPLYESDAGKEVRVVFSPLYCNYQDKTDFFIGSELAIYKAVFQQALPELILSLCVVLAGLFLLCLAIYHSVQHNFVFRLYAIGVLAVSAGVWRFTYGRFAYLVLENHSVLIYTISIISLMLIALSMLGCVGFTTNEKGAKAFRYSSLVYCMIYIVQLLCQLIGILDLRQMLQGIHITIVISAALLFTSGVASWFVKTSQFEGFLGRNYSWLLGIGVIVDLLLYYFAETSVGMLCTLGAILCFSMLEGIKLLISFTEQKNALEEMEVQLTLSRTITMMSQIRSHFVFNILNAISGMCKYAPEKADDTVVRFARYLRSNIDIMEDDKNIPFTTDLKQLEDYVALEQVRFGDKIEFYTDIEVDSFMIPPLILQPVVENAIKHGVSKKQTDGTIILRTRDLGESIVITVEDDGIGFSVEEMDKEKSVGLKNIRFRLQHLVNGTLDITSQVGKGTTVTIMIPKGEKA